MNVTTEREKSGELEPLRDLALCRGVLYGTFSLALLYPTSETLTELQSEKTRLATLQAALLLDASVPNGEPESADPADPDPPTGLATRVDDWIKTFAPLTLDLLQTAHGRLFAHTARGLVCPYETEHGQDGLFQQPRQLARIAGFYQAFGLTVRRAGRERADHASCELEFLKFLAYKEAYACESQNDAMLEETRKATRLFLKEHLGRFGRTFARTLTQHDADGFFGRLGETLFDFVTFECRRLAVQPGPSRLRLRSAEDEGIPMACGGGSELVQLEASDSEE